MVTRGPSRVYGPRTRGMPAGQVSVDLGVVLHPELGAPADLPDDPGRDPAASMPSGMTMPGGTVAPPATSARRPTITPSSTVEPLPIRASAPMTQPCTTH